MRLLTINEQQMLSRALFRSTTFVEEISMNVSAIAGTGDSRLTPDQREPGIKKKKQLRDIIKRNAK